MKLYRKSKKISFDEKEVEIYEIGVKELLKLNSDEYKNEDILVDCTNLTQEEIDTLNIEAFNLIYNEFFELNKEHFEQKEGSEKLDKKKS